MTRFDFPVVNREDFTTYYAAYDYVNKELEPFVLGDKNACLLAYCHYFNLYHLYTRDYLEFEDSELFFYIVLYKMLKNLYKDLFISTSAFDTFEINYFNNPDNESLYYFKGGDLV